ncbi:MAG: hypothetical protein ACKOCX_10365 [Planctomycetota bacterium]
MDTETIIPPPDDDFEPSQPARPGRLRRFVFPLLVSLVAVLAVLGGAAAWSPAFYRARLPAGGPVAEQAARRLVTTVSAMHADFLRVGRWEGLVDERDVNAWLAIDLPRNHADILPVAVLDPRVEFLPGRLRAGVRLGRGLLSATCWIEAEVSLREPNQLGIRLVDARLGGLPLPRGPILRELAGRLERLGTVTETRWQDGRGLLVVYIPSTHQAGGVSHWLEAVRFAAGELAVAGETRQGAVRIDQGR